MVPLTLWRVSRFGDGEVSLGFAGFGLFGVHHFQEVFAILLKVFECAVGNAGDIEKLAD